MAEKRKVYCKMLFVISKMDGSITPIGFTFPDSFDRKVMKWLLRRKLVNRSLDGTITMTNAGYEYLKKHGDPEAWNNQLNRKVAER